MTSHTQLGSSISALLPAALAGPLSPVATAGGFTDLHTILDTTLCLLAGIVAALLWIPGSRPKPPVVRSLALGFAAVALLYALHALVAVSWTDYPGLTLYAARLRPATWPPPAYLLPISILLALRWGGATRAARAFFGVALAVTSAVLLTIFFFVPPYVPEGFLGVSRPSLLLVPLLWLAVGLSTWRRRGEGPLFEVLMLTSGPMLAAHSLMLFSRSPHDTVAMIVHVGAIAGLLGLFVHLMQAGVADLQARIASEREARQLNEELERRVQERTARIEAATLMLIEENTERRRAEEALRVSEAQLRSFVEQAPADIAMFDRNMICLAASRRWVKDYSRGHDNLVGLSHYDVHPDVPERWKEIHRQGLAGIPQSADEDSWVHADGTTYWLRWAVQPWRDAHGDVGGIMILAEDITEGKRAQEALAAERSLLRTVFDLLPDFMYVKDTESRFLACNEACAHHLGASTPEELIGKTDAEFYPRELAAQFRADELAVLEGKPLINKDEGFTSPDGVRRSILTTKVPLKDGHGSIRGLVGIGRDISEREQAERRLATQYAVTRVLAESTSLAEAAPGIIQAICETVGGVFGALWEIDRQAKVLRCANVWHVAGLPVDELEAHKRTIAFPSDVGLPGRVWSSGKPLVVPDIASDGNFPQAPAAAKAGLRSAFGFPILLRGEVASVVDFLGREMRPPDRDLLDMLAAVGTQIGQFIEHRQAEAQVVQAQKMEAVGQLAGGIAHDFNNLLGVILGYGDLARRECEPDSKMSKRVDAIQEAAQRAAALTRQILTFSRKQPVELRVCDLNGIVEDMEKMLRRLIGEDVRLAVVPGLELGRVRADPGQLEQVIMNLAVNARDAMPGGGRLVIETSNVDLEAASPRTQFELRRGPHVMLAVSDTGQGMSPETVSRIFEPFFTTKEQGMGTGLGLAVVYGVVKQSGGGISVYSEPGRGTTFKVYFPRVDEVESVGPPPTGEAAGGTETVLLVEDEDSLRAVTAETLRMAGYTVLEAKELTAALLVAAQADRKIDLIITDVVLPGGSGPETALQIRAGHPEARVLLVSGYTDKLLDGQRGIDPETPFLGKPFTIDALLRKVREVLDGESAV